MKKLKVLILSCLFMLPAMPQASEEAKRTHIGQGQGQGSGSGQGSGQGHGCEMPTVDEHVKVLAGRLSLTQSQQVKITAVLKDQLAQLSHASRRQTVREASAAKIAGLLTDSQKKQFAEMQRESELRQDCSMIWLEVE